MENLRSNTKAVPRVGVIGCGNIGSKFDEDKTLPYALSHCGAYQILNIPITALADPNETRLIKAGKKRNVEKLYTDGLELLEKESIEILSLCTPTHLRYQFIKKAVEEKIKVIICEKPLANTLEEAEKIKALLDNSSTKCLVNYSRRWDPTIKEIREKIQKGKVGVILQVNATYGKGILNNGGHLINLCQYFFDAEFVPHYTRMLQDDRTKTDPTFHTVLLCKSKKGDFPIFLTATDHQAYTVFEMDIIGTKKRIQLTNGGIHIKIHGIKQDSLFEGYRKLALEKNSEGTYFQTMSKAIQEAIQVLENSSTEVSCTVVDALETIKIISDIKNFSPKK